MDETHFQKSSLEVEGEFWDFFEESFITVVYA